MKTRIALTACLVGLVVLLGADLVSAARPKGRASDKTDQLMDMLLAKKRSKDRRTWLETKGNLAEI